MEFGIFNLMGSRDPEKPTTEVFAEVRPDGTDTATAGQAANARRARP